MDFAYGVGVVLGNNFGCTVDWSLLGCSRGARAASHGPAFHGRSYPGGGGGCGSDSCGATARADTGGGNDSRLVGGCASESGRGGGKATEGDGAKLMGDRLVVAITAGGVES